MKQYGIIVAIIFFISSNNILGQNKTFKDDQMRYERVRTAYKDKEKLVAGYFQNSDSKEIFIRVFKEEAELEIWVRSKLGNIYRLLHSYIIYYVCGNLGPKRQQGDNQVPEGFYYIDRFNPVSSFYLSLGINYPNESDRILGVKSNLGGDIFIHGSTVTIGCFPMTDDLIKEIYIICVEARNAGQINIPVYIFPFKMTDENINKHKNAYDDHINEFWNNLKEGYDYFESCKTIPRIYVDKNGKYIFK